MRQQSELAQLYLMVLLPLADLLMMIMLMHLAHHIKLLDHAWTFRIEIRQHHFKRLDIFDRRQLVVQLLLLLLLDRTAMRDSNWITRAIDIGLPA